MFPNEIWTVQKIQIFIVWTSSKILNYSLELHVFIRILSLYLLDNKNLKWTYVKCIELSHFLNTFHYFFFHFQIMYQKSLYQFIYYTELLQNVVIFALLFYTGIY